MSITSKQRTACFVENTVLELSRPISFVLMERRLMLMTREEAKKYLIRPVQTSTEPSEEYKKQLEAYYMAVEALNYQIVCEET